MFKNSIALSNSSDNLNQDYQSDFHRSHIAQFSAQSSNKTLAPPSRNLTGAVSGPSTTHSLFFFRAPLAVIRHFISWLFRTNNHNPPSTEQINSFTRSLLSNIGDPDLRIRYVEDIPAEQNAQDPSEIAENFQQFEIQLRSVRDLRVSNRDRPAALDLLLMSFRDLDRRLLYWAAQREMIGIRKARIEGWWTQIQEIFSYNKEQSRLLFEAIQGKEVPSSQYKERVKILKHGIRKIENDIKKQDEKAQNAKKGLMKKYQNRCTSPGAKSLYSFELNFVWEVRKQYTNLQSLKRASLEFLRKVRELNEANLGNIMEDVYQSGRELEGIGAWQELQIADNEKQPLILIEKSAYFWSKGTLGKVGPVRVSLTADKFLMIYKVSAESREPTEYAQFKIEKIIGRKDLQNNLVLIGRLKKTKPEFKIEFLCIDDLNQFLECYQRSYERSFLQE